MGTWPESLGLLQRREGKGLASPPLPTPLQSRNSSPRGDSYPSPGAHSVSQFAFKGGDKTLGETI